MKLENQDIIDSLCVAYGMEMETIANYIAASVNLDGVSADVIKKALAADVPEELTHAQTLADRIKTIGGTVPGSYELETNQKSLQPNEDSTNLLAIVQGVIDAEEGAIIHYNALIKLCDGRDYVTQDTIITILADEEKHRRDFIGFYREFEKDI